MLLCLPLQGNDEVAVIERALVIRVFIPEFVLLQQFVIRNQIDIDVIQYGIADFQKAGLSPGGGVINFNL